LAVLRTPLILEPVEPPRNRIPLPEKPEIVRGNLPVTGAITTRLTLAPITSPLAPDAVPVPSSVSSSLIATLAAFEMVRPVSADVLPIASANVTAPPADTVSRCRPSTVFANEIAPPAVSVTSPWSVTGPSKSIKSRAPEGALGPSL
jgi:hypothetical protein